MTNVKPMQHRDVIRTLRPLEARVLDDNRLVVVPAGTLGGVYAVHGPATNPTAYEIGFLLEPTESFALGLVDAQSVAAHWRASESADEADPDEEEQARTWQLLYERICALLRRFGKEDAVWRGDYWVVDDNWGFRQQKIYINNLDLLRPSIIKPLQRLLAEFPDWEIMAAVSVPQLGESWPTMGLTIRAHEIVDGLQRQYFPKQYQHIEYEGSRRGTDRD